MPIIVKDFTWNQTDHTVAVYVPLHNVPSSRVDIFTSDNYFKASFETFFFECFPFDNINTDESKATILNGKIIFELKKDFAQQWPQLEKILTKAEKKEVKSIALLNTQEKLTKKHEEKRQKTFQMNRDAVSLAVAQDTKQREEIAAIKEQEKVLALGDLEELQIDAKATKKNKSKIMRNHYKKVYQQSVIQEKEITAVPMPRNFKGAQGVIEVEFTARALPTPSRESTASEEQEWLAKQAIARRSAGFVSEDLRPEERNPDFILNKGIKFLQDKNYLGAISAFTFGIEIAPKLVEFYIARSQAHFEVGNHHKCTKDCSTAIELMKPEVYANLTQRVECIHRRGMSLFKLGLKRQAEGELRAAINLQPSRELTRDLYAILDSPDYVEKPHESVGLQEIDH